MKYGYKEVRKLGASKMRALCCERNWYTKGDIEEYDNLLKQANKENISTDDIVEMASNIVDHSDIENYDFLAICDAILFKCHTFIEET